eukprot:gene24048-9623_t
MLKVMAAFAPSATVKNYHLELLTLLAQGAAAARGGARVADGSMQLVLDVLQSMADDEMPASGAAETQVNLSEDQFRDLVSKLKVKLVFGYPGVGSPRRPVNSSNVVSVHGLSVMMEDLALAVPDLPGISLGQNCIFLTSEARLEARGCIFSSPNAICIGAGSRSQCHVTDCCFGPDKERGASAGVVVEGSSYLVAERCLFMRCHKVAVEVRRAGSTAHLRGCKFIKCQKQAAVLHSGSKELVMEDCLIERGGNLPKENLLVAYCGTARLHKCCFVNNRSGAVELQCGSGQSAPVLDMKDCILKGNMSGVAFALGEGGSSGGGSSGILVNNQITDNADFGVNIPSVAPNQQIHLIGNVFRGNGPTISQGKKDIVIFPDVKHQVDLKNNSGTICTMPFPIWDALDVFRRYGRN